MATFSITSSTGTVSSPAIINVGPINDDGCQGIKPINVVVPTGTTKHVSIIPSAENASPVINQTITTDTTYNLIIIGDNSTGTSITTTIDVVVRDGSSSGPVEVTENYSRQHSGNIC